MLTGSFMKPSRKLKRVLLQKWVFFACDPGHDASKDQMLRLDTATGAELTGKKKDELDIKGADGKTVHNVKLSSAADACKWLAAVENNIAARRALPSHLAASAAAKPPLAATAVAVAAPQVEIQLAELLGGPSGPPAATSYAVMVPQGAMPGATLMTTNPAGQQVHVVVPQGAVPGSTFMVSA